MTWSKYNPELSPLGTIRNYLHNIIIKDSTQSESDTLIDNKPKLKRQTLTHWKAHFE